MPHELDLYLASASPRRQELLRQIGVRFEQLRVDVPEQQAAGETAEAFVRRLARDKAGAGCDALGGTPVVPVLGADTVVVCGDQVLGKPRDREHAIEMLTRLSGTVHRVLTGVALLGTDFEGVRLSESHIGFAPIGKAEIEAYWETGEPADKAGAYAVQGRAAQFVRYLRGSYSGVMGLPLYETAALLREAGMQPYYKS